MITFVSGFFIYRWVGARCNSIANTLELCLSCPNPLDYMKKSLGTVVCQEIQDTLYGGSLNTLRLRQNGHHYPWVRYMGRIFNLWLCSTSHQSLHWCIQCHVQLDTVTVAPTGNCTMISWKLLKMIFIHPFGKWSYYAMAMSFCPSVCPSNFSGLLFNMLSDINLKHGVYIQ